MPTLTHAERHRLIREWNETGSPRPANATVHGLFEQQARRTPTATAILADDESVTYDDLDSRAIALAAALGRHGVDRGACIGVATARSVEMVVALLGILKVGAHYVPLDPELPRDRLEFMIAEARPSAVIAGDDAELPLPPTTPTVMVHASSNGNTPEAVFSQVPSEGIAYVLYTSGSTGQPKGVVVPHRSVVNALLWMQEAFPLEREDRFLHKAPLIFDASVAELFWPLIAGATVVLAPPQAHRSGEEIAHLIVDHRVTALKLVPSMLRALLRHADVLRNSRLRFIHCGGELLTAELYAAAGSAFDCPIYNLYGPTETTIDSLGARTTMTLVPGSVPIGRPIGNTQVYVLDESMEPVPVGAVGELYIGGLGLAHGYLRRPSATADAFVPDPYGEEAGGRLYRTGDRVRFLRDGSAVFVGRTDSQIKVRGYRIELAEIEAVVRAHPLVRDAVVVAREGADDIQLVTYVVLEEEEDVANVRAFCRSKLPEQMIPTTWMVLDRLPLLPSGKLDRVSLPDPDLQPAATAEYQEPQTELERSLVAIWADVLGLATDSIGVNDDFFDLGGHSLLAAEAAERIRSECGLAVPLRTLFESPTISALAGSLGVEVGGAAR